MSPEIVLELVQQALWTALLLASPILSAALVVGVAVSILQAATQVNEMTLTFVPKLAVVAATIWVAGGWMLEQWLNYASQLWLNLATGGFPQ